MYKKKSKLLVCEYFVYINCKFLGDTLKTNILNTWNKHSHTDEQIKTSKTENHYLQVQNQSNLK